MYVEYMFLATLVSSGMLHADVILGLLNLMSSVLVKCAELSE